MPDEEPRDSGGELSESMEPTPVKEDAETYRTRKGLKQTAISEKQGEAMEDDESLPSQEEVEADGAAAKGKAAATPAGGDRGTTPQDDDDLREEVSSPKKKRAHRELEETEDSKDDAASKPDSKIAEDSAAATSKTENGSSRTDRSEPEKKRHRDETAEASVSFQTPKQARSGQRDMS